MKVGRLAGWRSLADLRGSLKYSGGQKTWFIHTIVLLGYLLLSIALTWPLLAHWSSGVVGVDYGFEDASQNIWNMWWTRRALEQGRNPFWTPLLYYPDGVQMYVQTFNIFSNVVTLPAQYLANQVAAFNSAVLLACVLTGYGGFVLVRAFVPGTLIPFICGALLTAAPFHMMKIHVNQLNLINMQWLPLFFLALLLLDRHTRSGDQRRTPLLIAFAVAMFVLATLTDWYWMLMCGFYTLIWFAISFARWPQRWILLRRYVWFGAGVALCLAPLFLGIFLARDSLYTIDNELVWRGYVRGYSSDALGLGFPSVLHPLWGAPVEQALMPVSPGYATEGWYVAAGWVLLLLAGLGAWWSRREQWQLLLTGGLIWLLSLGPSLRIAGLDTGIPLPYALIQHIPLVGVARRPSHLAVVCIVLAALFAGIGLHQLGRRLGRPRRRAALLLAVGVLAVIELWPPPRALLTFEQPDLFRQIRERPGAVADLPLEWTETSRSLRNQMVHEQPVLGSYVARRPAYDSYFVPLLHQLGSMERRPDIVPAGHAAFMAMQCSYPVRHAVVEKDLVPPSKQQGLAEVLAVLNGAPLAPLYDDQRYTWYELPRFPDQCAPFVYLGRGWYDFESNDVKQWRWAGAESDIWLVNPYDTPISAQLLLRIDSFALPRPVEIWQDTRLLARWHAGSLPQQTTLAVRLAPGENRLTLRAEPWLDAVGERLVTVPVQEVSLLAVPDSFATGEEIRYSK